MNRFPSRRGAAARSLTFGRLVPAVLALALAACGGGGGSSSVEVLNVSGVAAVGKAIVGGDVAVRCVSGTPQAGVKTGSDGAFRVRLQGAVAPCMVEVSGGKVGSNDGNAPDNTRRLHGYAAAAGVAHATTLSELVLARALGGSPAAAFQAFGAGSAGPAAAAVAAASAYVADQFAALGLARPQGDLLGGAFEVGKGNDLLIDDLNTQLAAIGSDLALLVSAAATQAPWAPLVTERACAPASLAWSRDSHACSAEAGAAASGEVLTLINTLSPNTGTAAFTCTNGQWSAPAAASCDPPPSPCAAQTASWSVNDAACSAPLPQTPSGGSVVADDTTTPLTGSATYSCTNGQWSAPGAVSCSRPDACVGPGCGGDAACTPQSMSWTVNGNVCSASVAATASGGSATAVDGTDPTTGSARYTCSNGSWSAPAEASCNVPADCPAQSLSWTVGANTCSAAVASTASGAAASLSDGSLPTVGAARFSCSNGRWGAASDATCTQPPQGEQTLVLNLQADNGGRWYDYSSNAYAEIGRARTESPAYDGFFCIQPEPGYCTQAGGQAQRGTPVTAFPFKGAWAGFGTVRYDLTGYTGTGAFSAPIRSISGDVAAFAAKESSVLGTAYTTTWGSTSGTVTLQDGRVTAIALSVPVSLGWASTPFGPMVFPGTFVIDNGRFTLKAGLGAAVGSAAAGWDFTGSVTFGQ